MKWMAFQYNHPWPLTSPSFAADKPAHFICIDSKKCQRSAKAYRTLKTLGWPSRKGQILLSQHLYYLEVISNLLHLVLCGKIPLLREKTLPVYLKGLDWVEFSFAIELSRWYKLHCNFDLCVSRLYSCFHQSLWLTDCGESKPSIQRELDPCREKNNYKKNSNFISMVTREQIR